MTVEGASYRNALEKQRDYIARIVAETIRRLTQPTAPESETMGAAELNDKVISAATIRDLSGTPDRMVVGATAIITPAAHDEAKARGIRLIRMNGQPISSIPKTNNETTPHPNPITDATQPQRAVAVAKQLQRRGISHLTAAILLSDTPAAEVCRLCQSGKTAVMIGSLADVDRFAAELTPNVWVLDMKRLNLVAAVNVATRITQQTSGKDL